MTKRYSQVAIAWSGLPIYAAKSVRKGIEKLDEQVFVIGSLPLVPAQGMEKEIDQSICWIDAHKFCCWSDLKLSIPDIFFQTGWSNQGFNNLGKEVRQHGGLVVSMIDNSWKNNYRQWLGSIVFRLIYKKWFDAVWVPGNSGICLCSFLGMPAKKIYKGLYCASQEYFYPGLPLIEREKTFLFVGRFIKRKGIDLLVQAFKKFHAQFPDWRLHVIGSGEMEHIFSQSPGIVVQGFKPPELIAEAMRQSRFLVLPSRQDHWGVVLHEAARSGCGLITSKAVGASADLVSNRNGCLFKSGSVQSLYQAMIKATSLDTSELQLMFDESLKLSSAFSPEIWAETFVQIIADLRQRNLMVSGR